jgi:Skp family chaperone for outer membrane proteins
MHRALYSLCLVVGLLGSTSALAQDLAIPSNPILVVDSEGLFLNSAFGKRVARDIEARGTELSTQNRQIETELATAEQDLTDRRASMSPEEFQPLADAFDTRVQETRQAQAAKSRALNAQLDSEREAFLNAAGPILQKLMLEAGASVVLDRRTVFISNNGADITAAAIARLNESLGQGTSVGTTEPD